MDTRMLGSLLDIQAMQTLGSVQSFANGRTPASSLFSDMINEFMYSRSAESSPSGSSSGMNFGMIGGFSSMNNLMYTGGNAVFKPDQLFSMIQMNTQASASAPRSANSSSDYTELIRDAAARYNIPESLISSVIRQESNFNNASVSHAGAMGLMQLMPMTAKMLGVQDAFDPAQNINGGAKYLRQMLDQFGGSTELALAAYNAGPGNVKKYGGIPPFKETQNYVRKVLSYFHA